MPDNAALVTAVEQDLVTLHLQVNPVAGDVTASNVTTQEDVAVNFLASVHVTDTSTSPTTGGSELVDKVVFNVPTGGWSRLLPVRASLHFFGQHLYDRLHDWLTHRSSARSGARRVHDRLVLAFEQGRDDRSDRDHHGYGIGERGHCHKHGQHGSERHRRRHPDC